MNKNYLSLNKNDSFAFLRGLDLQELLAETEDYFLEYRDTLNLPSDITFGVEIEYESISKISIDKYVKKRLNQWISKVDDSLDSGGEVTSPVMTDKLEYWQELQMICKHLTKKRADTMRNAGGHIHIGACVLGSDIAAWRQFLKLYIAYENVLFRFAYGDKISGRKGLNIYACSIAYSLYKELDSINEATTLGDICIAIMRRKRNAVNFSNVDFYDSEGMNYKKTIEFRLPNATTNEVIWQNNINTFTKMLVAARDKVMNEEFLDYKIDKEFFEYYGNEYLYDNVNLKNVLEFVDLVFDNNLDKIYFLRQYLKNFEDNYGIKKAVSAKKIVK